MTENTQIVTVLTGDLVNSTALGAEKVEMAFNRLQEVAKDLEAWHGGSLLFTRHRGDGWQVVLREPKYALRSVLLLQASVKSLGPEFDTYIGAATGRTSKLSKTDLNRYMDPAFAFSGSALDQAKSSTIGQRIFQFGDTKENAMTILADFISSNWTQKQSEAVVEILREPSTPNYSKIANKLGKSRQAFTKSLEGAGFSHINAALQTLEFPYD